MPVVWKYKLLLHQFAKLSFLLMFTLFTSHITWKVSTYGAFSGPHFPVLGLNISVNLRIQSEYRKMRARKNYVFGHFSRSVTIAARKIFFCLFNIHSVINSSRHGQISLTNSFPMHPFAIPWKHQKTIRLSVVFSG